LNSKDYCRFFENIPHPQNVPAIISEYKRISKLTVIFNAGHSFQAIKSLVNARMSSLFAACATSMIRSNIDALTCACCRFITNFVP